jgi:hypothetical protein
MNGQFSVYQFFSNDKYEEVLRFVDAETAVRRAKSLTEPVGDRPGTTVVRVIITDALDLTVFEWQRGKGVTTFPPPTFPHPPADFAELAAEARPKDDAEWGSERQIAAENKFFEKFHEAMGDTPDFDRWCLKATTDEMIDEALRLLQSKNC